MTIALLNLIFSISLEVVFSFFTKKKLFIQKMSNLFQYLDKNNNYIII